METSRSVPQQTAQIFSPFAGQKRPSFLFSQIGQGKSYPRSGRWEEYRAIGEKQNCDPESGHDDFVMETPRRNGQQKGADDAQRESVLPKVSDVGAPEDDAARDVDVVGRGDQIADGI